METKNIYQRLHAAMELVSYVQKDPKKNGMQYTFASHDAVTAKVRPALLACGIVAIASVKRHAQDGNRTETLMTVRFVNVDKPDDFIEVDSLGYGIDPQDKGPGKAASYATKYAFLKVMCLETGDDPERDQIPHENEKMKRAQVIAEAAANAIRLFAKDDEIGAYEEVSGITDSEEKLILWNLLSKHSALRASLKRSAEKERAMSQMTADRVPVTMAEQG